ncbi:MAG: hypothetical protein WC955_03940 [Elusimicrobiota bacterium]
MLNLKPRVLTVAIIVLLSAHAYCSIFDNTSVTGKSIGGCYYPGDLSSTPLNPAGISSLLRPEVIGSYYLLFDNARFNYLGYANSLGNIKYSISACQLYRDNIEERSALTSMPTSAYFSQAGCLFTLAGIIHGFGIGTSIKTSYYDYNGIQSNLCYGMDIGIYKPLFFTGNALRNMLAVNTGISALNILPPSSLGISGDTGFDVCTYRLSANASLSLFPRYNLKKELLSYDELKLFVDCLTGTQYSCGLEYRKDMLFARIGYNAQYSGKYSLGLGFMFSDITLNYSFIPVEDTYLHALDMSYRWGTPEKLEEPSDELRDFLDVKQKAERLYGRYYRQASDFVKAGDYDAAIQYLEKIIPISPDKQDAKSMLELCKTSKNSRRLQELHAEYSNLMATKLFSDAFERVLCAVDISPGDMVTLNLLEIRKTDISIEQLKIMDMLTTHFADKLNRRIIDYVHTKNYTAAELEYKKLEALEPYQENTGTKKRLIEGEKKNYTNEMVRTALNYVKDAKYPEAYLYLKEAYRISADDAVKAQMMSVYRNIPRPGLYDDLYQKKLYYIAAISYTTDDIQKSVKTYYDLVNLNSAYPCEELESVLAKNKYIQRKLP